MTTFKKKGGAKLVIASEALDERGNPVKWIFIFLDHHVAYIKISAPRDDDKCYAMTKQPKKHINLTLIKPNITLKIGAIL
jgi:hypothetical protein